jgi:uncharacterized protein
MNRICKIGLVLTFLVILFSFQVYADNGPGQLAFVAGSTPTPIPTPAPVKEPRLITVTGDAEVRVVPDDVVITAGVETSDLSLDVAKSMNSERVARLLALAKSYKITVRMEPSSIEPKYQGVDQSLKKNFLGYQVRKTIEFPLKNDANYESFLINLLGTGATHILGVQFRASELNSLKDQARQQALKFARQKAAFLAKELGCDLGKPYLIREDFTGWQSWYNAWWSSFKDDENNQLVVQNAGWGSSTMESRILAGQITVRAVITVSYEIE